MATTPFSVPFPSTSPSSTTTADLHSAMDPIVSLNLPVAIKLTDSNFLTWKSQILPLIHGYNLAKFLEASPPSMTIPADNGQFELNPAYLPWHRQDQLLLGWLRSSLTESILAQVISSTTSKEFWRSLEDYFSSTSRARLHELKRQIQTASKGDISCSEYLLHLRRVFDELAFIGAPLPEDELVSATITGLGMKYNSIVAAISTARCHGSLSFSDLRGLLLSHEALLKSQSVVQSAAFYAGKNTNNRTRTSIDNSFPLNRPVSEQPSSTDQIKPTCQICSRYGHSAKLCYHRYAKDNEWKPNPRFKAFTAQASPATPDNSNWILDSGANNHVTNDLNNLSSFFAYTGPDKLQIGNGLGLSISNIGSSSFTASNISFTLHNVLHVPHFSTNLIILSRLLHDNPHISINFSSSMCIIKDLHTKNSLELLSINGLYLLPKMPSHQVSNVSSSHALLGIRTTSNVWHARLGHPSNPTTIKVINTFQLPCIREPLLFCHDCIQAKAHVLPFSISSSSSNFPLQLVHSDVWGPSPILSFHGYKYYISFVDDYSHFTWIYFMKQKSEVLHIFSKFKAQVENLLNTTIKTIRTDGGAEYKPITTKFPQIVHQTSCPHTPQQNGVAERKHRHIVELALANMCHASIPQKFWDEIFFKHCISHQSITIQ